MNLKILKLIIFVPLISFLMSYFSFGQVGIIPPPEEALPAGVEIPTNFFGCLPTDPLRFCLLKIIGSALRVILVLALGLAAIFIALAGFTYITKGASEDARKKANNRLIYAAFGLVVAFLSWALAWLISQIVGRGRQV